MRALALMLCLVIVISAHSQNASAESRRHVLVIHGGAGVIPADLTAEREAAVRGALKQALLVGHAILKDGGTSLDAVTAAIRVLEDSPEFNAGKGSVLTAEGEVEMDAAVMEGAGRRAGAVAGVRHVRNPIELARVVMEKTSHVLVTGGGAEELAKAHGVNLVPTNYFVTERRVEQWKRAKEREREDKRQGSREGQSQRIGTVGAVALDQEGNLAAGTSTGGMVNKRFGRVGDSPIIGAGTYADKTCAVSCTGHGEYFIRTVVGHDMSALMEYKGFTVARAAAEVLAKVRALGGNGGLIAVDKAANIAMSFNTEGMYRGVIRDDGEAIVDIGKPKGRHTRSDDVSDKVDR